MLGATPGGVVASGVCMKKLLVLVILAGAVLSARAAAGAPKVLYGPGVDASEAASIAKQRLKVDAVDVIGSLADQIGAKGATPVVIGAPSVRCDKPARRPLKGEFLMVDRQMSEMEYTRVRATIDDIIARIACYGVDASRDDLYTLFFTKGMAAFYDEQTVAAQSAFSQAVAIDPSRPWPTEYPPTAKPLYDEALRVMTASAPIRIVSSVEGEVRVNGEKDFGKAILYPGGHLVFVPETSASLWVTIPRAPGVPEEGILLVPAAELLLGLLAGNDRFAPWLQAEGRAAGWGEVVILSKDGLVQLKDDGFYDAAGNKVRIQADGSATTTNPVTVAGVGLLAGGVGIALGGVAANMSAFDRGLPKAGTTLIPKSQYESLERQNTAGLVLAGVGAGVAVAGAVVTVISLVAPDKKVAVVPWMTATDDAVGFGLSGRLP